MALCTARGVKKITPTKFSNMPHTLTIRSLHGVNLTEYKPVWTELSRHTMTLERGVLLLELDTT